MVFRVEKTKNFTVMSNYHFKDKRLSLKAKGLLSIMLSLPTDWDYSISGLVQLSKDGESAVRTALTELEDNHYLKRERIYENGKIVDWDYIVYEQPYEQSGEDLVVENQHVGNQHVGNRAQYNTNLIKNENNKKLLISKDISSTQNSENFEFGKPEKLKRKSANDLEHDNALIVIGEYTDNMQLKRELTKLVNLKREMASKERHRFYCSTIQNYLDNLTEEFGNDEAQKIEAVKLSIRYNGTTKVMKPNNIQTFSRIEQIEGFTSLGNSESNYVVEKEF